MTKSHGGVCTVVYVGWAFPAFSSWALSSDNSPSGFGGVTMTLTPYYATHQHLAATVTSRHRQDSVSLRLDGRLKQDSLSNSDNRSSSQGTVTLQTTPSSVPRLLPNARYQLSARCNIQHSTNNAFQHIDVASSRLCLWQDLAFDSPARAREPDLYLATVTLNTAYSSSLPPSPSLPMPSSPLRTMEVMSS